MPSDDVVRSELDVPVTDSIFTDIEQVNEQLAAVRNGIGRVIFGQQEVIDETIITLLAGGHLLLLGLPGLAKTRLIETLGTVLGLKTRRVQCTPDLMPADIIGSEILDENEDGRSFRFFPGPVFTQVLMADEINRASPRTQSALLQAMQEREVSVAGHTHALPSPFHVLATQNPIEQEGTYPLPEAQLDRFMFLIEVDYPTEEEERRIARETTGVDHEPLEAIVTGEQVLAFQKLVRRMPVPDHIYDYAVEIVRKTRPASDDAPSWIKEYVGWGAGPRAVQYLVLGAKGRAALRGNYMASLEDIEAVAVPVLSHRVITNFAAESQGMTSKKVVERLVEEMRED